MGFTLQSWCLLSLLCSLESEQGKNIEELGMGRTKGEEAKEELLVAFELYSSVVVFLETWLQGFVSVFAVGCSDLLWLMLGLHPPPMQMWLFHQG